MRKLSIAVLIAGMVVIVALSGCGGGGGGASKGGTNPITGNTIVTGTVMDNQKPPQPVANVTVMLGSLQSTTNTRGVFEFDLGPDMAVASLFNDPTLASFSVQPPAVGDPNNPPGNPYVDIVYGSVIYAPSESIPLPVEVYNTFGTTTNLGTITMASL